MAGADARLSLHQRLLPCSRTEGGALKFSLHPERKGTSSYSRVNLRERFLPYSELEGSQAIFLKRGSYLSQYFSNLPAAISAEDVLREV